MKRLIKWLSFFKTPSFDSEKAKNMASTILLYCCHRKSLEGQAEIWNRACAFIGWEVTVGIFNDGSKSRLTFQGPDAEKARDWVSHVRANWCCGRFEDEHERIVLFIKTANTLVKKSG